MGWSDLLSGGGGGGSSAAGAGAGLIGGLIGTGTSFLGQANSEQFARRLAQRAIRWRAHDMRMAGINPILAARPGGLSGSSIGGAGGGNIGAQMAAGAQAATQGSKVSKERQVMDSSIAVNAQSVRTGKAQQALYTAGAAKANAEAVRTGLEATRAGYGLTKDKLDSEFYQSPEGRTFRNVERVLDSVSDALPNWFINTGNRAKTKKDKK